MFNILERTISLWILFKDKFLAIFVQTVIFRMTFLAATDMILMHADMLFLDGMQSSGNKFLPVNLTV